MRNYLLNQEESKNNIAKMSKLLIFKNKTLFSSMELNIKSKNLAILTNSIIPSTKEIPPKKDPL
jgi:hypothetical protein